MEKREECTALQQIKIALLYLYLLQRERALGVKLKSRGEKNGRPKTNELRLFIIKLAYQKPRGSEARKRNGKAMAAQGRD